MRIPAVLVVSLASVIAGSIVLSGVFQEALLARIPGQGTLPSAQAAQLPFHVTEQFKEKRFAGDAESGANMEVDDQFVDPEQHCEFCTRVESRPGAQGVAGFSYEDDALDFTGAKKVHFWVMGEDGGEKVKFKLAGKDKSLSSDKTSEKDTNGIFSSESFAVTTEQVVLDDDWKKYEVDLEDKDLKKITHPFGIELEKGQGTQVIYIKGIIYDDEAVNPENLLTAVEEQIDDSQDFSINIEVNGTDGDTSTTFRFEGNVSGGEEPYSYEWDFDGEDQSDDRRVDYTFAEVGTYNVTLVVADASDQKASDSVEIRVSDVEGDEAVQEQVPEEEQGSPSDQNEPAPAPDSSSNVTEGEAGDNSTANESSDQN
ncbi:MAG: PKD domain-containing protein [Nitrososphaera sp.]|nr:PKD domain-containing protein [Nitrososphaera sp.]